MVVSVRTRFHDGKFQVHCCWKEQGNTKNKYGLRRASEACAKQDEKAVKQKIDENPANPLAAANQALQEWEAVPDVVGLVSTSHVYARLRGVPVPSSGSAAAPPSAESSLTTPEAKEPDKKKRKTTQAVRQTAAQKALKEAAEKHASGDIKAQLQAGLAL